MAYDSIPHDGISTGHAASTDIWSAPYSSAEWTDYWKKVFSSDAARGYVIPGYGNNLRVTANSPAALNVLLATGAAFVRGRAFENTAQATLTITTADATNPRLDRVILTYDSTLQTVVPSILAGTPAGTPSLPALTQTASTYQISIAYIWVAATATTIADTDIHDERIFEANFESLLASLLQTNLLVNSEYMAFSSLNTYVGAAAEDLQPPEGWSLVLTPSVFAATTKPAQMIRGQAVSITADAASEGMSQTVRVRASTTYSLKVLVNVTAGDVGVVQLTTNSGAPGTILRNIRRTGTWLEELIYYTTEADATTMTLSLLCLNNTDVVQFGQALLVEGYQPGPFREVRETIPLNWRIGDASWDGDAKADGIYTIDFDTDFQSMVLEGTRAVIIQFGGSDSSSQSGTNGPYVAIKTRNVASDVNEWVAFNRWARGLNSVLYAQNATVLLDDGNRIYVETLDEGTLTAQLWVVGIVI